MFSLPSWQWWQWGLAFIGAVFVSILASFSVWLLLRDDHEYDSICGFFVRVFLGGVVGFGVMSVLGLGWIGALWGAGFGVGWGKRLFERLGWQAADSAWVVIWLSLMSALLIQSEWLRLVGNMFAWLVFILIKRIERNWRSKKWTKPGFFLLLGLWLATLVEIPFAINGSPAVYFALAVGVVLPPILLLLRSSNTIKHIWQKIKRKKNLNRSTQNRF